MSLAEQPPRSWFATMKAVLNNTRRGFTEDECTSMAAALAYYTVFSLPAVLVVVIVSAGSIWGPGTVEHEIEEKIAQFVGKSAAHQVGTMVTQVGHRERGLLPTVISIGVLLFAATGAMAQLQYALNKTWGVRPSPRRNTFAIFAIKRLLSFGMVLAVGFLLMVSMVLTSVLNIAATEVGSVLPQAAAGWPTRLADLGGTFFLIIALFAAMFKWLPDARLGWKHVLLGSIVTASLFMLGKFAIGLYLGRMETSVYGAASSLVLILVWIYYSAMIVLLGAEFTEAWATRNGERIRPGRGAVRVARVDQPPDKQA